MYHHPSLVLPLLVSLSVFLCLPPRADAQSSVSAWDVERDAPARVDISASVGYLSPTDWSDHVLLGVISPLGVVEQVLAHNMHVDTSTAFNATVTYWRGRYGFRVHAGYSQTCVAIGGRCGRPLQPIGGLGTFQTVDVDTWMLDIGGAIGLIAYTPRRWVWPYIAFGIGGVVYDVDPPVRPPALTFIEHAGPVAAPAVVVLDQSTDFVVALNELGRETTLALNINLGTDFRVPAGPAGLGVRLEIGNYMTRSPVSIRFGDDRARDGRVVHNLRASAGLVLRVGR